ncbi:hypothetical protein CAOG_06789 [Capsaspora owczarzaki ATCC 30864]|uniref:DNA-directed RNA polymerase subunit n=1 Tax=Capsaspora owczarzaki (strain ATCC 30864) TaxID=595528 RepID=A0A0D2UN66_CAPO3|nr:hypothetical protein CAOG_06789 [Capsaspora owczarzaki ATCC 30864]KJE96466.1 hypothetical protein CAOG_006789 [Capsaspora owczarzaki ATCC 30864]|eukprot:XP_004344410.1 hypothetical protein CAOG_06789 [Capsaspora owczarzaki ATCC 30864]
MLVFCPTCSNLLVAGTYQDSRENVMFRCATCPYVYQVQSMIGNMREMNKKEVDDVMGRESDWDNVDQTDANCPKCGHTKAYYRQVQTRSADEPMTIFLRCSNMECKHNWRGD